MSTHSTFSPSQLLILRRGKTLHIRAGVKHRFIGIWMVVVEGRLFARSWSLKALGWYRYLLEDPRGFIKLGTRTIPVRAIRTRSTRLKTAVDRAYLTKYSTTWEAKYARDLASPKSRAATLELRPTGGAAA